MVKTIHKWMKSVFECWPRWGVLGSRLTPKTDCGHWPYTVKLFLEQWSNKAGWFFWPQSQPQQQFSHNISAQVALMFTQLVLRWQWQCTVSAMEKRDKICRKILNNKQLDIPGIINDAGASGYDSDWLLRKRLPLSVTWHHTTAVTEWPGEQ